MHDAVFVQIIDGLEHLLNDGSYLFFFEVGALPSDDPFVKVTPRQVLHHYVNAGLVLQPLKNSTDIRVVERLHDVDFVLYPFELLFVQKILRENFYRPVLSRLHMLCFPDFSQVAVAHDFTNLVHFFDGLWVALDLVKPTFEHRFCVEQRALIPSSADQFFIDDSHHLGCLSFVLLGGFWFDFE